MLAVAFLYKNQNIDLYTFESTRFETIPTNVSHFPDLLSISEIDFSSPVYSSFVVPNLSFELSNVNTNVSKTISKSRYFTNLEGVFILDFKNLPAYDFAILLAGFVDSFNFSGNTLSAVVA